VLADMGIQFQTGPRDLTCCLPRSSCTYEMSSDSYFDDDELDDAAFQQLDAIEAAHLSPTKIDPRPRSSSGSSFDITFDIDESDLARIDNFIIDAYQGNAGPVVCSNQPRKGPVQTTLFGDILPPSAGSTSRDTSNLRNRPKPKTSVAKNLFGQQAKKTKVWDHTEFAKSGSRRKSKGKRKDRVSLKDDEEEEEELVEFEQFPAPFVSGRSIFFYSRIMLTILQLGES
jgi:ATP-dependent DNA helicase MPH1